MSLLEKELIRTMEENNILRKALEKIKDEMVGGFVNEDGQEFYGEPTASALIACEALGLKWETRNVGLSRPDNDSGG
jgi:hypothetical protein